MTDNSYIWPNDPKGKLPEDLLLAYLEGKLPPEQQHEVERWLATESMESDAVEGLQQLPAAEARQTVQYLDHQLNQLVKGKKKRRKYLDNQKWAWVAVIIILLLTLLAYTVIYLTTRR